MTKKKTITLIALLVCVIGLIIFGITRCGEDGKPVESQGITDENSGKEEENLKDDASTEDETDGNKADENKQDAQEKTSDNVSNNSDGNINAGDNVDNFLETPNTSDSNSFQGQEKPSEPENDGWTGYY